ncbi:hypothetical protein GA0070607_6063 [Micromonospora coriariae]|uniref:Uncharacterized protein n=1 Tax=Micromonospora coriariae TaxID=285665 RepID=A0A1C4Y0R1_9ACTN|nr:DUF6518 family protein [Micromonospora coriariae]SCF14288.1 hypothetical protein GA0070607_6063 [Micromonospora coriariae]
MRPGDRTVALASVVGGFLLGFLDFCWIKWLPFPIAELGNSTATWAVAAFFFGYRVRSGRLRSAVGAAVLLVVAVPSYYLAAALLQGDDLAVLWAPSSLVWMFFGVLAGVVFGTGGTWARGAGWRQVVGIALPVAVFFEEAARFAGKATDPNYTAGAWWNVAIDLALGLLIVVRTGGSHHRRALAVAVAVPLAAAILVSFAVAGGTLSSSGW